MSVLNVDRCRFTPFERAVRDDPVDRQVDRTGFVEPAVSTPITGEAAVLETVVSANVTS